MSRAWKKCTRLSDSIMEKASAADREGRWMISVLWAGVLHLSGYVTYPNNPLQITHLYGGVRKNGIIVR